MPKYIKHYKKLLKIKAQLKNAKRIKQSGIYTSEEYTNVLTELFEEYKLLESELVNEDIKTLFEELVFKF